MSCVLCKTDAPTKTVSFHQNIGMLVTRQEQELKGEFCRKCAKSTFLSYTLTTLFLGWWGIISFCVTPFMILGNIFSYVRCLSLPEPTIAAMNVSMALHDVSTGRTRGLTFKIIYGTIVWGTIGVLVLQNSPQFLYRYSPRLSTYFRDLGLLEGQAPENKLVGNVFGQRTLKDGTEKAERVEFPDGQKQFEVTVLPDGTKNIGRLEFPNGKKWFDTVKFPDGTQKVKCIEFPNGEKDFDATILRDGTYKVGRIEFPTGQKWFELITLTDGTEKVAQVESPNGERDFNATILPDGTYKAGRIEYPNGQKWFDMTKLPDGTQKIKRVEFSTGKKRFDVTILPDGIQKVERVAFPTDNLNQGGEDPH